MLYIQARWFYFGNIVEGIITIRSFACASGLLREKASHRRKAAVGHWVK
jgi:hypothetical protein